MTRKIGFIEEATFEAVILNAKEMEVGELVLHHSGEPLLHPKIGGMVRKAKQGGLRVSFTTNGNLLREKADEVVSAGLDAINVSISEGATKEDLEALFSARKNGKPKVTFSLVEGEKANDFGFKPDNFISRKRMSWSGAVDAPKRVLRHWAKRLFVKPLCGAIDEAPAVLWDGTVVPCCMDFNATLALGNIREKPLSTILGEAEWLRKMLNSPELTLRNPTCGKCAL